SAPDLRARGSTRRPRPETEQVPLRLHRRRGLLFDSSQHKTGISCGELDRHHAGTEAVQLSGQFSPGRERLAVLKLEPAESDPERLGEHALADVVGLAAAGRGDEL